MPIEIEQIEAIFKKYWEMPRDLKPSELRGYATEIVRYLEVNDGYDGLLLLLSRIQTNRLEQQYSASACEGMASRLLKLAKGKKRPRDPAQLAKFVVDVATGEVEDLEKESQERAKDAAAVSLGRRGGLKGGKARSASMTPEERRSLASKASKMRWAAKKSED